jgi:hypothetical protein
MIETTTDSGLKRAERTSPSQQPAPRHPVRAPPDVAAHVAAARCSKLGSPLWPKKTHIPDNYVTAREALKSLLLEPSGRSWHGKRPNIRPSSIERYKAVPEGGNRFDLAKKLRDLLPRCWAEKPTGTTDVFGRVAFRRP